jgi:hypothetical protein
VNSDNEKKRLSQEIQLERLLREPKPTEMLIVYQSSYGNGDYNYGIHPALIPLSQKDETLESYYWDLSHDSGVPRSCVYYENGEKRPEYFRFGSDNGIEPLVICRNFHDARDGYQEVSEEFRFFHNLYHDRKNNRYIKISDDGNETTIIEESDECIKIRLKELKQFLAIKDMCLSIQFDYREHTALSLDEINSEECCEDNNGELFIWSLCYGNFGGMGGKHKAFSCLLGKKIILPFQKSKSGLYGFSEAEDKKYLDFIIDTDEVGDDKFFNSNPDLLANNFGSNPEAPHYLTPVHFDKKVLDKYYGQPSKYSVEDSYLRCASLWGLQMDNHHDNKVCVWLGDLGRDLPYQEQLHWRSHNIPPEGGVSKTYFNRQILAQFANSERPEHIFKSKYDEFYTLSIENLGWEFLLPLGEDDAHHFDCLRIPSTNEQRDFDDLVLGLTKILIDSLNEKSLNKYIDKEIKDDFKGGISRLEFVLNQQKMENFDVHIQFLRKLQNLRSSSSAHRKGTSYKKIASEFDIGNKDLVTVFEGILEKAIALLDYFSEVVTSGKLVKS